VRGDYIIDHAYLMVLMEADDLQQRKGEQESLDSVDTTHVSYRHVTLFHASTAADMDGNKGGIGCKWYHHCHLSQ